MITIKRVLEYIDIGESLTVEFKQRFSSFEKMAKEMIAFANTRGGYIFLGVDDNKSIYGIESEKSDIELIDKAARQYCEPPLNLQYQVFQIGKKEILVIEISESSKKPLRIQDFKSSLDLNTAAVYVRVNDKSVLASKEMIKLLQIQAQGIALSHYQVGNLEKIVFKYLDINEVINVKELSKTANVSERRASRALIKLVRANILFIHTKDNGENYFSYAG